MKTRTAEAWPTSKARITGVVYLLYFMAAIAGKVITDRGLIAFGEAVSLGATLLYAGLTMLFYALFESVNRGLTLLAVVFSLLGCANDVLSLLNLAPFHINSLVFFGPFDILIGYLILRSTFLPRILGALMVLAGLGWLIFVLLPPANFLVSFIEVLGFIAEVLPMLWLLVKGVNNQRGQEQASAAREPDHSGPGKANG